MFAIFHIYNISLFHVRNMSYFIHRIHTACDSTIKYAPLGSYIATAFAVGTPTPSSQFQFVVRFPW